MARMWTEMLVYLHYALALMVSIRVLLRPRLEPAVRLSWILVIEVVPLVGIIAYVLFGEIRMRGAEVQRISDVRDRLSGLWQPSPYTVHEPFGYATPIIAAARATGGFYAVVGNDITMLPEGDDAMDEMVAAIDAAHDHVHILFYIWLDDQSGAKVAQATIRAAKRGVRVRAIIDAIGSRGFSRSQLWADMGAAGVEQVVALPLGLPIIGALFQRMDLRNHRKILVVDNELGFTGSRNCADMAFATKPRFAPWIDILLRIRGPVVRQMQAVFLQDWMSYTGEDLGSMLHSHCPAMSNGAIAQVIATGPDRREGTLSDCMVTMIHAARSCITITTPYYVPDTALDSASRSAARRGVTVTMILPEHNDSLIVEATSEGFYHGLLRAGVVVYLFQGGLLHTKAISVDDRVVMLGSANMDRRSFEINYEMNMLVIDHKLIADLDERQQSYINRSRRLNQAEVADWSVWRRLRNNLLALASPLL